MRRLRRSPRPGWQQTVETQGLVYGVPARNADGTERPYWDESVYYEFSIDEVDSLEADVEALHSLCLDAVEHVVLTERYKDFGLPEWSWPYIAESWRRRDPYLYGRFDLRYDAKGPAKLLEYNGDTPTSLLEASILQWYWYKDVFSDSGDQWNSLHEKLVERWGEIRAQLPHSLLHLAFARGDTAGEDHITTTYIQETAAEAGFDTVGLAVEDIGWDSVLHRFVDLAEDPMRTIFKLYPWEWLLEDPFGKHAAEQLPDTLWIEPLWKTLLSNKALLAILYENNPGHPNLLPAYLDDPGVLTEYIKKPKLGREGANMTITAPGYETSTGGVYGKEGYVYQLFAPLPEFDGMRPVIGAWVVGDRAAGMGIRETSGLITDDGAAFVPHRIAEYPS